MMLTFVVVHPWVLKTVYVFSDVTRVPQKCSYKKILPCKQCRYICWYSLFVFAL